MKKIIAIVCLCVFTYSYASAEGYQVNSQSARQAAMGHVGTSMKLGAESMHFNPAGLGFLANTIDLSAGVSGVFTNVKYSNDSYSQKADNEPSTPLYLYGAFKIYDFLSAGISLTTPYGSSMNWGTDWAGAGLIQDIALKSFSIQPTMAWKVTDRFSVGAGMMIMFGNFSLSRALIPPGGLEGLRPMTALNPVLAPILDKYTDTSAASATLSGDAGVKLGYNLGVMFDITDQFTIGMSYRSKVMMKVNEGHAVMNYPNETELKGMIAMVNPYLPDENKIIIPPFDQGTFEAELPLPSNFNIGLTYKPTDRWQVSGEVQFVGWGAYKELNVQFSQEEVYSINAVKDYQNTRIYRLGAQYAATNRFDIRLGTYFDESPVKDEYLNPETPSMNKLGIATGFSFRPLESWSIDLALSYVTGFGRDGSYPTPTKADPNKVFAGHYDVSAFTPTIGIGYRF